MLLLCLPLLMLAQDKQKKTAEQKAKDKTAEMVSQLQLKSEQEKLLYHVNLKAYTNMDQFEAKHHDDPKLVKKQKKAIKSLREKEYKKIMSAEQYKKHLALEKEEDRLKALKKKEKVAKQSSSVSQTDKKEVKKKK